MSEISSFIEQLPLARPEHLRRNPSVKWASAAPLNCFIAEMDFAIAPPIRQALSDWAMHGTLGYQPPELVKEFTAQIQRFYAEKNWQVPTDFIRPVSDVVTLFRALIDRFLPAGQPLIFLTPSYMNFLQVAHQSDHPLLTVPLSPNAQGTSWELDWERLEQAFATTKGRGGLFVLINPHNPLGKVYSRQELCRIAELAYRYNVRIFADEIHSPLVFSPHQHIPFANVSEEAAAVALTGFSVTKAFSIPGTKAAALLLSNEADFARWMQDSHYLEFGTGTAGYVATIAALSQGGQWFQDCMTYLTQLRTRVDELMREQLPTAGYIPPQGTYLAWVDFHPTALYARYLKDTHDGVDTTASGSAPVEFASWLAKHTGVLATDGSQCGPEGQGHLRINFATHEDTIEEIFTRLGTFEKKIN